VISIRAEVRRQVIERAGNCCEYCLFPQKFEVSTFHIEHIIPRKHGGSNGLDNLCLSCPFCNTYKGSDFASFDPQTGELALLYHPRKHQWNDHFKLNDGKIEALTPEGRVTVLLLRLNRISAVKDREALIKAEHYPCRSSSSPT
jgi:hypothetical protein